MGGRYFLVLSPLLALAAAAFFEKLRDWQRAAITLSSAAWSAFLLVLFLIDRELDSYAGIGAAFGPEGLSAMRELFTALIGSVPVYLPLRIVCATAGVLLAAGAWRWLASRKRIVAAAVILAVIAADGVLAACARNDRAVIERLRAGGFYDQAVRGDFDKGDLAEAYFESTGNELRNGRIDTAIIMLRRAMELYPPEEERGFTSFRDLRLEYPGAFEKEFLVLARPYELLGLGLRLAEDGNRDAAAFYIREARRRDPGVLSGEAALKSGYIRPRLESVKAFTVSPASPVKGEDAGR